MEHRAALMLKPVSNERIAARAFLEHPCEVFGAHDGRLAKMSARRTNHGSRYLRCQFGLLRVIDDRRATAIVMEYNISAVSAGDPLTKSPHALLNMIADSRRECSNRAAELDLAGNDIVLMAAIEAGDADHGRLARIDRACCDLVEAKDDLGSDGH